MWVITNTLQMILAVAQFPIKYKRFGSNEISLSFC